MCIDKNSHFLRSELIPELTPELIPELNTDLTPELTTELIPELYTELTTEMIVELVTWVHFINAAKIKKIKNVITLPPTKVDLVTGNQAI